MRRSHFPSGLPLLLFSGSASLRLCARPNPLIPRKDGGRSPPYRRRPVSVLQSRNILFLLTRRTGRKRGGSAERNEKRRKKDNDASQFCSSPFFAFFRFFRLWWFRLRPKAALGPRRPLWRKTTHMMRSSGSSCLSPWSPCLCGEDIGTIFSFCETHVRPDASFMRHGTVLTVRVEFPPVLTYSDAPWGWAPNPGIFRLTPMA
jgi:hypothetical protein